MRLVKSNKRIQHNLCFEWTNLILLLLYANLMRPTFHIYGYLFLFSNRIIWRNSIYIVDLAENEQTKLISCIWTILLTPHTNRTHTHKHTRKPTFNMGIIKIWAHTGKYDCCSSLCRTLLILRFSYSHDFISRLSGLENFLSQNI